MMEERQQIKDPKILVINPSLRPTSRVKYFPIGLGYVLSAMERADIPFTLMDIEANRYSDSEIDEIIEKTDYNIVLTGALVTGYKYTKDLARRVRTKQPDCVIVAGNSVATSIADHLLNNTEVDIAVMGEGDITVVELLNGLARGCNLSNIDGIVYKSNGKITNTLPRPFIKDINSIPIPNWDIFDMDKYLAVSIHDVPEPYPMPKEQIKAFVINTARGCPYKCTFCYHVFITGKYRYRSPESILAEISLLQKKYGINYVFFFDELTFFSVKQTAEFVDKLLESGLKFHWCADVRSNLYRDNHLPMLKRMKEAGCVALGYSLETGEPEILKAMKKKLKVEDFIRQKIVLEKAGIKTFTSLVFGYPQETVDSIRKTLQICYDLNVYPSSGYLLPQPATPMFEVAKEKGLIPDMEDYLMKLGDRQDLRFNLTSLPDYVLQGEISEGMARISEKLGMGLSGESLLKAGAIKISKESGQSV